MTVLGVRPVRRGKSRIESQAVPSRPRLRAMSAESSAPEILGQFERLNQLLGEQVRWIHAQSFSGSDDAGTVGVTLDGQLQLVGLQIEDGLLRLGAEAVEQRINAALLNARMGAVDGIASQQGELMESLFDVTREMVQSVETQLAEAERMGLLEFERPSGSGDAVEDRPPRDEAGRVKGA